MSYAALQQYGRSSGSYLSGREIEVIALNFANRKLREAQAPQPRREALAVNIRLWSTLLNGVQDQNSPLPPILRQDLVSVGTWAMRYSNQALNRMMSLDPLIDINQDMIDGLSAGSIAMPEKQTDSAAMAPLQSHHSLALVG
jgi:flagellar biosynthesis regulator FlaF